MIENPSIPEPLAHDLSCRRCAYNLRTLLPSALCPECGSPVTESIKYWQRFRGLKFELLLAGALMIAAISILLLTERIADNMLHTWLFQWDLFGAKFNLLETVFGLAFPAVVILGLIPLHRGLPLQPGENSRRRTTCIALAVIFLAVRVLHFIWRVRTYFRYPGTEHYFYGDIAFIFLDLGCQLALAIAALSFVRRIASRTGQGWITGFAIACLVPHLVGLAFFFMLNGVWLYVILAGQWWVYPPSPAAFLFSKMLDYQIPANFSRLSGPAAFCAGMALATAIAAKRQRDEASP